MKKLSLNHYLVFAICALLVLAMPAEAKNNSNGPTNVGANANAGAKALAGASANTGNSTASNGDIEFKDRLQFPNLPPATAGSRSQGTECPIITEISNGKQVFVLFGSSTVGKERSLVNGICVLYWRAKESGAKEDWQALSDYAAETDPVYKKVMKIPETEEGQE